MCFFGTTRTWTGGVALVSFVAVTWSSSYTFSLRMSPATMRQKRQSLWDIRSASRCVSDFARPRRDSFPGSGRDAPVHPVVPGPLHLYIDQVAFPDGCAPRFEVHPHVRVGQAPQARLARALHQ